MVPGVEPELMKWTFLRVQAHILHSSSSMWTMPIQMARLDFLMPISLLLRVYAEGNNDR